MTQLELFRTPLKGNPACTQCRLHKTANSVCILGTGPRQTDVMVVGEAPGRKEDRTGAAATTDRDKAIESRLKAVGVRVENVYFCNAVSCRPPDQRPPSKGEIKACRTWLFAQVQSVKPKFVLLLGNSALMAVTGAGGIKKQRGRPFEKNGVVYLPTYHPSAANYDDTLLSYIDRDFAMFASIINEGGIPRERSLNSVLVRTEQDVAEMLAALKGTVSFDIETSGLYPWAADAKITAFGFGTAKAQYTVLADIQGSSWTRDQIDSILDRIQERLPNCSLVAQNGKFDLLWMWVYYGVRWQKHLDFDTMLAHYMIDENDKEHGLKHLAQKYCGAPNWDVDKETKRGEGSVERLVLYHAHDLYYTRQLKFELGKLLKKDPLVKRVFEKLMMPVARLFVEVEYDGVWVDEKRHSEAERLLRENFDAAEKSLKKWGDINWGSSKQLGKLLFSKKAHGGLGLTAVEKTKKGAPSCGESAIKQLDHSCVEDLLKFKEAKQQLSFFIEGWKPFFHKVGGHTYLHPSFKLGGTVTGRPSCQHPNLQQVPRDERIRSLLGAPPGWTLIDADLSQIELRIAAELAGEKELIRTFQADGDPHWVTAIREIGRGGGKAKEVVATAHAYLKRDNLSVKAPAYADALEVLLDMGADAAIEIDKGWKELRKKAKAINFGYLFGMWWKKFKIYARDHYGVKVTDEEAQASREFFFSLYSGFPAWHKKQKAYARNYGYVRTLTGRKRRLPAAMAAEDSPARGAAERQAINSPVQGFAAELNLMVALQLREEFPRSVLRIVGTVHDAILMRVRNGHEERVLERVKSITARPKLFDVFEISFKIPIRGDAALGPWGAGKNLSKWKAANGQQRISSEPIENKDLAKVPPSVPPKVRTQSPRKKEIAPSRLRNNRPRDAAVAH